MSKSLGVLFAVAAVTALAGSTSASVMIDTVTVGNPGNPGELTGEGAGGIGRTHLCGGVDYAYSIGKFEITSGQYTAFLNAVAQTDSYGLYKTEMGTSGRCEIHRTGSPGNYAYHVPADWANRPVCFVDWSDAYRFANWMHNGQPTGMQDLSTTEDGSYYLNGSMAFLPPRQPDATWVLPTEDEWYKAAYHKNDGATDNYWDFPMRLDMPGLPNNGNPEGDTGHSGNFMDYEGATIGYPYYTTPVGYFSKSSSAYGTFDQGGNVWEMCCDYEESGEGTVIRGQSAYYPDFPILGLWSAVSFGSGAANSEVGFRLAQVPEPSSLSLLALVGLGLLRRQR